MDTVVSTQKSCESLVRTQDPDRYLLSMFYPPEVRAHLWSLYAFNHEIAKTREVVTDTNIGLIRLQWWRDALGDFYEKNEVKKHDVMTGLAAAIWRYNLQRDVFDHLIYAREFDLEDRQPGSLEGLCNYVDYTHTPLLRMAVIVAGENPDDPALQPVAMAYALAGLIRAVPYHMSQSRCFMPEDLMRRAGINFGTLQIGQSKDDLVPVITAVRDKAEDLLRQAGQTEQGRMVRLHRVMTEQYLNKIKQLHDNCYDVRLSVPPAFRTIGLWRTAQKA
jgi:NADH dehydrogenase [ubiquinone] 1 alpha subcomplex assembly factor 6